MQVPIIGKCTITHAAIVAKICDDMLCNMEENSMAYHHSVGVYKYNDMLNDAITASHNAARSIVLAVRCPIFMRSPVDFEEQKVIDSATAFVEVLRKNGDEITEKSSKAFRAMSNVVCDFLRNHSKLESQEEDKLLTIMDKV